MIRFNQTSSYLHEAEHITMFLVEMSVYRKEWQLALPDAFQQILFSSTVLLDTCVSLLIRPRLLAYVIEVFSNHSCMSQRSSERRGFIPGTPALLVCALVDQIELYLCVSKFVLHFK